MSNRNIRMQKNNHNGFSLIEALVAGVISVLVLAVLGTLYQMNLAQTSGGVLNTRLQMQYQTVVEQIGYHAHEACWVGARSTDDPTLTGAQDRIYLFNTSGIKIGGYKRLNTDLQEFDTASLTFHSFTVGGGNVQVTSTSGFIIAPDRKSVTMNLSVFSASGSRTDTALTIGEVFSCRNR